MLKIIVSLVFHPDGFQSIADAGSIGSEPI
jgi:hypothetical protein